MGNGTLIVGIDTPESIVAFFLSKNITNFTWKNRLGDILLEGIILGIKECPDTKLTYQAQTPTNKLIYITAYHLTHTRKSEKYPHLADSTFTDTGYSIVGYSESEVPWKKGVITQHFAEYFYT